LKWLLRLWLAMAGVRAEEEGGRGEGGRKPLAARAAHATARRRLTGDARWGVIVVWGRSLGARRAKRAKERNTEESFF